MVRLNKVQRNNLSSFFIDIAKALVVGYVISNIFGKISPKDIIVGTISAAIFLTAGLLLLREEG